MPCFIIVSYIGLTKKTNKQSRVERYAALFDSEVGLNGLQLLAHSYSQARIVLTFDSASENF